MRGVETDVELLARLREGDEDAFVMLVERYQTSMLRLARSMVPSPAVAEEAVQDAWMGVVRGVDRFEGRSTLKTWLFRILANRARSAGSSEYRHARTSVPLDAAPGSRFSGDAEDGPAVDPSLFDAGGHWAEPVQRWGDDTEDRLDALALAPFLKAALEQLPARQRQVVVLRDLEGLSSNEVCDVLGISPGNQRLLLHRGRTQLRTALETVAGKD